MLNYVNFNVKDYNLILKNVSIIFEIIKIKTELYI